MISATAITTANAASPSDEDAAAARAPPLRWTVAARESDLGRDIAGVSCAGAAEGTAAAGTLTGSPRVASTGISGSGSVASGASSDATTRAHARSVGNSASRWRMVSLTFGGDCPRR